MRLCALAREIIMRDVITVISALAEPTRLEAIRILFGGGEHCVCELMSKLNATQSRMSRHMGILKSSGPVVGRRDAQWVRYRLNPYLPPEINAIVAAVTAVGPDRERKVA